MKFLRERITFVELDLEEANKKLTTALKQKEAAMQINHKLVAALNSAKVKISEVKERCKVKLASQKCKHCDVTVDQQVLSFGSFDVGSFDYSQLQQQT